MANRVGTTRNKPKSIKAVSRGMGIGISMLPNQTVQTTAIPQTPAVCTAAVKWKNLIHDPDKRTILVKKDENSAKDLVDEKSKQTWLNLPKISPPQSAVKKTKQSATSIAEESQDAAPADADASRKTPTTTPDSNSTARASLVSAEVVETDTEGVEKTPLQQVAPAADTSDINDADVVTYAENQLIAAIPCMPLSVAVLCLFLNIFVPGTGTIIASFSVFCCANKQQPVAPGKKEASVDIMITNLCVGVSQLFTVTFLFIGFIWSITWGVFMVQFAWNQYKKDKEERERTAAISVANAFMVPGLRSS